MSALIPRNVMKADMIWNETQQAVMMAIADVYVPSLDAVEAAKVVAALPKTATDRQRELVEQFAREGYYDHPELIHDLAYQARASLSTATLDQINLLLTLVGSRPGCLALTGRLGPFQNLDRAARTAAIARWGAAPLAMFKKAQAGFKGLALLVYYRFCQPAWEATGFADGAATDWREFDGQGEGGKKVDAPSPYDFRFENDKISQYAAGSGGSDADAVDVTISTDVLIVGSGAGGGVVAAHLAARGLRVLVAEKGYYLKPEDTLGREDQGYPELYEGGGLLVTEDGSLNILAGSTFGGGTTINWSASLKPRHFAREAWAKKFGLPYFLSPLFTNDLNAVCHRMGCSTRAIKHNTANSLLALGAQRAGHPVDAVPQNTGGHVHYCGKCQLGCSSGHKQGGISSWLRDAAETGNTSFVQNCLVERILFANEPNQRRAIGAIATVDGRKVRIDANKAVVVSSGSVQTPALLLRTPELKYNRQIGQRLHLHPTTVVWGLYDFPVNPWQGGILTMVSNAAEIVDPEGWGAKIEVIASSPSLHAAFSPFETPEQHKADMLRYNHCFELIVITRDRDGGEVFVDKEGTARVNYTISKHDQASLMAGILRACDIHMMAGARKICTVQQGIKPFECGVTQTDSLLNSVPQPSGADDVMRDSYRDADGKVLPESTTIPSTATPVEATPRNLSDPAYVAWRKQVEKIGAAPYTLPVGSAHQMGSCRMGATPRTGAVDAEGRVWGTKNLYVADASLLPEASGVNPMITTMGTSRGVARNIATDLGAEKPALSSLDAAAREARL